MRFKTLIPLLFMLAVSTSPAADVAQDAGHVQIPVDVYNKLVAATRDPSLSPRPAPARYVLGAAQVNLTVDGGDQPATGRIRAELKIDVPEEGWVLVPVLPAGTPVDSAAIDGDPIQLVAAPQGLGWVTNQKGSVTMTLEYRADARRSTAGYVLALPVPQAASIHLSATLPGAPLDASVIPAAGTRVHSAGSQTRVEATVPTTSGIQIAWRAPIARGHSISRARYIGQLQGDAIAWKTTLGVELFSDETATLQLFPQSVALGALSVDGKETPVVVEGGRFATLVKGIGRHVVTVGFETPIIRQEGQPRVDLQIPLVPISRFELTLPGKKELAVTPISNVTHRVRGGSTVATIVARMSDQISFAWSEAVPEEIRTEARANAALYHAVHAEEAVLFVHAILQYEVARGATNRIRLLVPPGVQVNRIESASGAIADWRIVRGVNARSREAVIFLNRELQGELLIHVHYDRSLGAPGEAFEVPVLAAPQAQRQRGMVALLASRDLTLDPEDETVGIRVGENQLPAFVRDAVEMTVAHAFKYVDQPPRLLARARKPDPVAARFDAQVDTLISLGDVAVVGAASVEINVKSGRVAALRIELPADVNLLNLSGPSLRSHQASMSGGSRIVDVSFTQEMEGQFRIELSYERLIGESKEEHEVAIATPRIAGAEVEQGRVAVEALSAVEVRPTRTEQLAALDVAELPRQLVLRTTNPILMAYKYLHADPRHSLSLTLTRHRIADVQEATIDRADYRTLYTRDGLQVTTADFTVRNSRKQFLKLALPKNAEIWSAFVDGKAEKPALSREAQDDAQTVLIKTINSMQGFPIRLVYAAKGCHFSSLGTARGSLPRPDILVTQTRWDVYLPEDMRYGKPSTNMDLVKTHGVVSRETLEKQLAQAGDNGARQGANALKITVPTRGAHFAFEKLYANQSSQDAWIALPYASRRGAIAGRIASIFGALLTWLGFGLLLRPYGPVTPRTARALAAAGLLIVLVSVGVYHVSATAELLLSLVIVLVVAASHARRLIARRIP